MSKIGSMEGTRLVVFRIFFSKVKRYLSMNPGAVFIVGFQSLLLACACLLIEGNFAQADNLAMYAFCLLVVGVILKAIPFLRREGEGELG